MGIVIRTDKGLRIDLLIIVAFSFFLIVFGNIGTASAAVIINVAPPTGTPETDWQNIQDALDSMQAGDTVQLAEGCYKIHKPLDFQDFNGTFRGAGKNLTTMEVSTGSSGELFAVIRLPWWDDWLYPDSSFWGTPILHLNNAHGEFNLEGLTIKATTEGIAERSYYLDNITENKTYIDEWDNNNEAFIWAPFGSQCNVLIENCKFLGAGDGYAYWQQPTHGIQLVEGTDSTITVRRCEFVGIGTHSVQLLAFKDGIVNIEDNVFSNCPRPIVLWNNSGCDAWILNNETHNTLQTSVVVQNTTAFPKPEDPCHVTVSGLDTYDSAGIGLVNYWSDVPFTCVFSHNTIRHRAYSLWAGIELWDYGAGSNVLIDKNKIYSPGHHVPYGPIFSFGVDGAVVTNNLITGEGYRAIYMGMYNLPTEGCLLKGNNVENFNSLWPQIELGWWTSKYIVIGAGNKSNVTDAGTDNILIGVNNMGYMELGHDIKEAIEKKKEMIENEGN